MVAAAKIAQPLVDAPAPVEQADLERRKYALLVRLEDGYQRIEQAIAEGQDVTRWEELWERLLGEYEEICDTLREAA